MEDLVRLCSNAFTRMDEQLFRNREKNIQMCELKGAGPSHLPNDNKQFLQTLLPWMDCIPSEQRYECTVTLTHTVWGILNRPPGQSYPPSQSYPCTTSPILFSHATAPSQPTSFFEPLTYPSAQSSHTPSPSFSYTVPTTSTPRPHIPSFYAHENPSTFPRQREALF